MQIFLFLKGRHFWKRVLISYSCTLQDTMIIFHGDPTNPHLKIWGDHDPNTTRIDGYVVPQG